MWIFLNKAVTLITTESVSRYIVIVVIVLGPKYCKNKVQMVFIRSLYQRLGKYHAPVVF